MYHVLSPDEACKARDKCDAIAKKMEQETKSKMAESCSNAAFNCNAMIQQEP